MTLNMYLNGTNRKDFRANAPPDLYPSSEPFLRHELPELSKELDELQLKLHLDSPDILETQLNSGSEYKTILI
jgi:hypothetical protein